MKNQKSLVSMVLFVVMVLAGFGVMAHAEESVTLSTGQTLYVPVYSHIYAGNRELPLLLTVTLSVRNVDPKYFMTVTSADYYGTKGELLKQYSEQDIILGPLESTHFIVPQNEKEGGAGANFIVTWKSQKAINPPLVECVMIGAGSQYGISFTSRGQVITTGN
jgi:hypothetical protein